MASALVAYLHFISLLLMFALLVLEHRLFQLPLDHARARSLVLVDLAYGASAGVVLLSGIARALWFAKGLDYYLHNAAFHALVGLFVLVALLSLYPTMTFLNWRNTLKAGAARRSAHARGAC
jgi:putative membrane protein